MALGNMNKKFGEHWMCSMEYTLTDKQAHRHAHHDIPLLLPYERQSNKLLSSSMKGTFHSRFN